MRTEVEEFANSMEEALKANDTKGGWKMLSTTYLSSKLLEEVAELLLSLGSQSLSDLELESIFRTMIKRLRKGKNTLASPTCEAADVGNVAMMLADRERRRLSEK